MIRIQKLSGVSVENNDLPTITRTAEGLALGHIPNWIALLDPAYRVGAGFRNRALPNNTLTPKTGVLGAGAFPNAQPSFAVTSDSESVSTFDINPNQWTVFAVIHLQNNGIGGARKILSPLSPNMGGIGMQIIIRTSGQIVLYESDTNEPIRITGPTLIDNAVNLIMFTFSTDEGLKCYQNGTLFSAEPTDRRPLNQHYLAGTLDVFEGNPANGTLNYGLVGVLNTDLGKAENAGYRSAIVNFCKTKYGIS